MARKIETDLDAVIAEAMKVIPSWPDLERYQQRTMDDAGTAVLEGQLHRNPVARQRYRQFLEHERLFGRNSEPRMVLPTDGKAKDGETALTQLEEAVEEAASAIDRDSGIPGIAMARRLRQAMRDFKATGGWTPLYWAARNGNAEAVRRVLVSGTNVNERIAGLMALHRAAFDGNVEALRVLLAAGANVNVKNNSGETPLDVVKGAECRELLAEALAKAALG